MKKLLKMKTSSNKGITLIALVITIIVLLILAGVSIAMITGENGILKKASEAKEETEATTEKEQVQIAYMAIKADYLKEVTAKSLQEELDRTVGKNKVNSIEKSNGIIEIEFVDTKNKYSINNGKVEKVKELQEYQGITITEDTEGVVFTKADGVTPGEPDNLETGDIVKYGDYEYHYNQNYQNTPFSTGFYDDTALDGWSVKTIVSGQEEYGELCGSIFGKYLKSVDFLFGGATLFSANKALITAPQIPYGVESMGSTFQKCTSLTSFSTIPSSVNVMNYTFDDCTSLEGNIVINANPTSYSNWLVSNTNSITISGESDMLEELANGYSNVTIL